MTQTGPDVQPPAQPGQPYQQWGPDQQPATPPVPAPAKSKGKKIASIAGAVVVAGGLAAFRLTGGFGAGDPSVGDCVQMQGETDFEVVDCTSADAEYKVVGIDQKEQTFVDSQNDPETCAKFPEWEVALWIGDTLTEPGTTYCAVPAA
jgi:hypothetical protein